MKYTLKTLFCSWGLSCTTIRTATSIWDLTKQTPIQIIFIHITLPKEHFLKNKKKNKNIGTNKSVNWSSFEGANKDKLACWWNYASVQVELCVCVFCIYLNSYWVCPLIRCCLFSELFYATSHKMMRPNLRTFIMLLWSWFCSICKIFQNSLFHKGWCGSVAIANTHNSMHFAIQAILCNTWQFSMGPTRHTTFGLRFLFCTR